MWGLERQSSDRSTFLCAGQDFAGDGDFPADRKVNQKENGPRPKQKNQPEMEPRNLNVSDNHREL